MQDRSNGLNWEESSEGVASAVAVAIREVAGMPLASISVSVPSMRLGSIAGIRALRRTCCTRPGSFTSNCTGPAKHGAS
jgi:DNA-binding IclR family transcriptional regulator